MQEIIHLVQEFRAANTPEEMLNSAERVILEAGPSLKGFIVNAAFSSGKMNMVDEIFQESLIKIATGLETFNGSNSKQFWSWCNKIARGTFIDHVRGIYSGKVQVLDFESLRKVIDASTQTEPLSIGEK